MVKYFADGIGEISSSRSTIGPDVVLQLKDRRFERGQVTEFGSRKLLAVLVVLGMEMCLNEVGMSGTLDELRRERSEVAN